MSCHIKWETKAGGAFSGQCSEWVLQRAPWRVHIQFPHLYFGSRKEQGDISAVFPGENSYRLLSVLNVHSIYLKKEERE